MLELANHMCQRWNVGQILKTRGNILFISLFYFYFFINSTLDIGTREYYLYNELFQIKIEE